MCGVVSLVINWLVRTFSRNVWQVIFMPTFCKRNCQHSQRMLLYEHDDRCITSMTKVPPHFSQVVKQYQIHKFPIRWIGHGNAQNWPPWSLALNPLDYHVWGYMKALVYAHQVNTANTTPANSQNCKSINNTAVLHRVTISLVTQVRKCIQADEGHFEQFAWVLNNESVTVHLTTQLNKCTMLLFPF